MHILTKEEVIERLMAVHNGKVIERQQASLLGRSDDCPLQVQLPEAKPSAPSVRRRT